MNENHEMVLEKTYSSGAEEWNCPICGRRLLMHWKPTFRKTVIEVGDEYAVHGGGKGGLHIGSMQVLPVDDSSAREEAEAEDTRLAPWLAWLDKSGFENLWKSEDQ
jgi:hypothetical protein